MGKINNFWLLAIIIFVVISSFTGVKLYEYKTKTTNLSVGTSVKDLIKIYGEKII